MAVSGTVSATVFNTRKVVDHAYRRCRIPPEGISSEQISFALDSLYLILSMLANRGLQLWCIERFLMPLYQAQGLITLPNGVVDILNTNLYIFTPQILKTFGFEISSYKSIHRTLNFDNFPAKLLMFRNSL